MSLETKYLFKQCVAAQQSVNIKLLALLSPVFTDDGFITIASMSACGGRVELRCGPAEYHVEIFIHDDKGLTRWTLRDLIALPNVREWMQANRADLEGRQRVEAEVEYAFRLLKEPIARLPEMNWLLRGATPPQTLDS